VRIYFVLATLLLIRLFFTVSLLLELTVHVFIMRSGYSFGSGRQEIPVIRPVPENFLRCLQIIRYNFLSSRARDDSRANFNFSIPKRYALELELS